MKELTIKKVKENNKNNLVKILLKNPDISRLDLTRVSGLSGGTVTALIRELMAEGIVEESKINFKTGGRPKVGLRVKPIPSSALIVEIKQRNLSIKSYDIYNNLIKEKAFKTNYLNGNVIVDEIVKYIKMLDYKIDKVGILLEENIIANEITYLFSTGLSQSQIQLESAIKMFVNVEVIMDYSIKYCLEDCLIELGVEGIELVAYINFDKSLNALIYNRKDQLELKEGVPVSIDLSKVFERIGFKNLSSTLDLIESSSDNLCNYKSSNSKKIVELLGEMTILLQMFYPLDAVFFVNKQNNINLLDTKVWNYLKQDPFNKLKLIKNVIPDTKNATKNMNHQLLVQN